MKLSCAVLLGRMCEQFSCGLVKEREEMPVFLKAEEEKEFQGGGGGTARTRKGGTHEGRHRNSQCPLRVEGGVAGLQQGTHMYTSAPPLGSPDFPIGPSLTLYTACFSSAHKHSLPVSSHPAVLFSRKLARALGKAVVLSAFCCLFEWRDPVLSLNLHEYCSPRF